MTLFDKEPHRPTCDLWFTVPGPPVGKQRARKGRGGRWYTPAATRRFERSVAACFLQVKSQAERRGWSLVVVTKAVELEVECYFADGRRRDGDNVLKAVSDALNGIAYRDDSQIVRAVVTKAIDRLEPRTVVKVSYR